MIQTHDLMSWGGTDVTNAPVVKPFTRGPTVGFAVAYTILRGDEAVPDSIGMLEFYAKQNGVWISAGIPESDFEGRTFVVSPIDSHRPDEEWYLVWGSKLGDTGARLNIRLYSFNGKTVQTIWQRDDLIHGVISANENSLQVEYDPAYQAPESDRIKKIFYLTPNGFQ